MFEFCSRAADHSPSFEAKAAVSLWPARMVSRLRAFYVSAKPGCWNFFFCPLFFAGGTLYIPRLTQLHFDYI